MTREELYEQFGTSPPVISKIRDSALPIYHKVVLIMLVSRASVKPDEGWTCWPSLTTLATDCSMSRAKVAECITDLRKHGAIEGGVDPEKGRASTTYRLDFHKLLTIPKRTKGQKNYKMR